MEEANVQMMEARQTVERAQKEAQVQTIMAKQASEEAKNQHDLYLKCKEGK
jgi:hypothetical protein